MTVLTDEQKALVQQATIAIRSLNNALEQMRITKIACNIRENNSRWYLDARLIITKEHYS